MSGKRFENVGKDIFQYNEWYCSAGGEHCAEVIAEALNILIEENNELKQSNKYLQGQLEDYSNVEIDNIELRDENQQLKNQNELLQEELEQCRAVIDKRWSEYLKQKELEND